MSRRDRQGSRPMNTPGMRSPDLRARTPSPQVSPSWRDRLSARIPSLIKVTGVQSQPRPRFPGEPGRGRQVLAGTWYYGGVLVQQKDPPWETVTGKETRGDAWRDALHGFLWLDDLAALGSADARRSAQRHVINWIERFGRGRGVGWRPGLTGMRQMRLISHSVFLLNGMTRVEGEQFIALLGRQTSFLARRQRVARQGLRQISATCGMVHSAAALTGADLLLDPALRALSSACTAGIGSDGSIASRNPDDLLQVFALLCWTSSLLAELGHPADLGLGAQINKLAPVLRALRMSDGALPQMHGGTRGQPGLLDHALRQSGLRPSEASGLLMGYARLNGGPVSVCLDAASPPYNDDQGHAGTLAIEMSSGRQPVVVSCGAGGHLGADWRKFGRTTAAHSTMELLGYASSRLAPRAEADAPLIDGPSDVTAQKRRSGGASSYALSHDGWRRSHGLTHLRTVQLEADGRLISGEDGLAALEAQDRDVLNRIYRARGATSLRFALRFHLHPNVTAALDMGGKAVSLSLPDGEVWVLRHGGEATLSLAPSVYLDAGHIQPRATRQIVLSGVVEGYGASLTWNFTRPAIARKPLRAIRKSSPLSLSQRV